MRFPRTAALGAAGAIALGVVTVPALAQDADDTTTQGQDQQDVEGPAPDIGPRGDELKSRLAAALAAELELPVEDVEAALAAVHEQFRAERDERRLGALEDRLAVAVEEGSLTQEQADAILEAAEEGVFPGRLRERGPGHFGGPRGPGGPGPAVDGSAADAAA